ncbi:MAG: hypothetical protein Q7T42_02155 [Methylotenera sp.]|uniref:hypothetical protein n=1 Tax=Methylotenera sp. TaxID=2051956 RepID=UPI002724B74E|nr:hypothetical protein [Methylotenera sp.]MDO9392765.1 hypothetical protein [Methylotenera sp.]MDP1522806.1 hypothetical protein [Methylotenera sp.]MDP3307893.1 hypothetical protein [Methylotenera sp.]
MLKKIIILFYVGFISFAPLSSSAAGNEKDKDTISLLVITNAVVKSNAQLQNTKMEIAEAKGIKHHEVVKKEATSPAVGWLLIMALLGFIILSNR